MSTWAIVPFRGSHGAKRRLEHALPQSARSKLVLAMLDDVLDALSQAKNLDGILLVSRSQEATAIARKWGATLFRESGATLVEALVEASDKLAREYLAKAVMIVPGDVPLISTTEVDNLLQTHSDVTLVPDQKRIGTNALICKPPNAFPYVFDGRSYQPHLAEATKAGLRVKTVQSEEFGVDVDTINDLLTVRDHGEQTRTGQLLAEDAELRALLSILNSDPVSE